HKRCRKDISAAVALYVQVCGFAHSPYRYDYRVFSFHARPWSLDFFDFVGYLDCYWGRARDHHVPQRVASDLAESEGRDPDDHGGRREQDLAASGEGETCEDSLSGVED